MQTLASVRLSQQNPDAAKEALRLSWGLWKHVSPFEDEADGTGDDQVLDEAKMVDGDAANDEEEEDDDDDDDDGLPPFETRIGWAKLAMECEMLPEAIEVLQGCEAQDDEDEECLYLLGVAWELMGEANGKEKAEGSGNGEVEMEQEGKRSMIGQGLEKEECWIEAREYLDSCLKVRLISCLLPLVAMLTCSFEPSSSTNGRSKSTLRVPLPRSTKKSWRTSTSSSASFRSEGSARPRLWKRRTGRMARMASGATWRSDRLDVECLFRIALQQPRRSLHV